MIFPTARASLLAVHEDQPEPTPAAPQPPSDYVDHVLIVEDNEEVLALASEILISAGYRVTTAISGEQGVKTFEAVNPGDHVDLLFTDLVMPGGMNGLMLADAVIERDPTVYVLLTTGYNEELVVNGPRKRATDVLSKPYRRSELLDRVRQAINRRDSGGPRR